VIVINFIILLNHAVTKQTDLIVRRCVSTLCPRKNYNPRQCKIETLNLNAS